MCSCWFAALVAAVASLEAGDLPVDVTDGDAGTTASLAFSFSLDGVLLLAGEADTESNLDDSLSLGLSSNDPCSNTFLEVLVSRREETLAYFGNLSSPRQLGRLNDLLGG